MNVFGKVKEVRQILRPAFKDTEATELLGLIREASKWHYNKRKAKLSKEGAKLYEILVKNGYNPDTVYKWFLLIRSPLEVTDRLRVGLISQKKAFQERKENRELLTVSQQDLLHEIIDCFRRYVVR